MSISGKIRLEALAIPFLLIFLFFLFFSAILIIDRVEHYRIDRRITAEIYGDK